MFAWIFRRLLVLLLPLAWRNRHMVGRIIGKLRSGPDRSDGPRQVPPDGGG